MMETTTPFAELGDIAKAIDARELESDARALQQRLGEGRFHLACVGQFKRGKSSLINALIGRPILPTGVTPVTSVVTIVGYGPDTAAEVLFADGRRLRIDASQLETYVSEASNPENVKRVAVVEVFVPAPLLADGLCLVDTPGIGSVFAGNTEITRAFLPRVDAAVVVLGGDPPISGDELTLIASGASDVPELIVVLNKADRLAPAERAEARAFTVSVLQRRLSRSVEPIYEVSATERLSGAVTRDWPAFHERLLSLTLRTRDLLNRSTGRQARRLLHQLRAELNEAAGALVRPIEQSQPRIADLERSVTSAERALGDIGALMSSEQVALVRWLAATQEAFVADARPRLHEALDARLTALVPSPRSRFRDEALTTAGDVARHMVEEWAKRLEPEVEAMYRRVMERFVTLANQFLQQLADSGDSSFDRLPRHVEPDEGFRERPHFYFTQLMHLTGKGPFWWLLDRVRPGFTTAVTEEASTYGERLISTNASRVAHDLEDRVSASRRELERELRFLLTTVVTSARRAVDRANERRREGEEAVRQEIDRLQALSAHLRTIEQDVAREGLARRFAP
jgi:GTP-binding protein EngB required for normal cell division